VSVLASKAKRLRDTNDVVCTFILRWQDSDLVMVEQPVDSPNGATLRESVSHARLSVKETFKKRNTKSRASVMRITDTAFQIADTCLETAQVEW
jgi:hypothetical protein